MAPLRHQLRHGGEAGFLDNIGDLRDLLSEVGGDEDRLAAVRREQNYFATHADHLHYADVEKRGCPAGSGAMESTCAQLQSRFKRPGQFWSEEGKSRLMAIEVAQRNGQDDELWFYHRELD